MKWCPSPPSRKSLRRGSFARCSRAPRCPACILPTPKPKPAMKHSALPRTNIEEHPMTKGLRKGLPSYGDDAFSLFLRKVFIKALGYSDDALDRPIVGITNTYSDYNPCHGNVP